MAQLNDKEKFPILIVDDEPDIIEALVNYLDDYEVSFASDAESALEMVASGKFKIVLTDIMMPGLDGIQLLRRIKAKNPGIQVIMMTGQTTLMRATESMQDGALSYLLKPFDDISEVDRAIEEAVRKIKEWKSIIGKTIMAKKAKREMNTNPQT